MNSSTKLNPIVVSDFDGVIANSSSLAVKVTRRIVRLFDKTEIVESYVDYRRLLGKNSQLKGIALAQTGTLRELHRMLMCQYSERITLFSGIVRIFSRLIEKPLIVSSSYSDGIYKALAKDARIFRAVYGHDYGLKENVLGELKRKSEIIYVTDTRLDISRCKNIGIPVIAVTWGYNRFEMLQGASPDFIAHNCDELRAIFESLNLINTGGEKRVCEQPTKKKLFISSKSNSRVKM